MARTANGPLSGERAYPGTSRTWPAYGGQLFHWAGPGASLILISGTLTDNGVSYAQVTAGIAQLSRVRAAVITLGRVTP